METIIYKGNQIRRFGESRYAAYTMDRYEDIEEHEVNSLEAAMKIIDDHIKGNEEYYEDDDY